MPKPLGYIIDQGSSPLDGKPYVAILTTNSSNRKTGNMCQVWIIRSDINPVEAIQTGDDYSICGDCPHRKQADGSRSCYVNVGQAPNSVYKAYQAGKYVSDLHCIDAVDVVKGRKIRWGAYGDPAIINPFVVMLLNKKADGHTGYTHQWRESFAQVFKGVFMASADGASDYIDSGLEGWKSFSVVPQGYKPASIKLCPATMPNSKASCLTCSLCDGAKTNVYVEAHGSGGKYVTLR